MENNDGSQTRPGSLGIVITYTESVYRVLNNKKGSVVREVH